MSAFAGIKAWLDGLPDQITGDPCAICQTGEPYVEFAIANLARPGDEAVVESRTAEQFQRLINQYFDDRCGTLYWRIPFEWEVSDGYAVIKYDDSGPDIDFVTNQKCFIDRNWRRVSCYARLYRSRCQTMKSEKAVAA